MENKNQKRGTEWKYLQEIKEWERWFGRSDAAKREKNDGILFKKRDVFDLKMEDNKLRAILGTTLNDNLCLKSKKYPIKIKQTELKNSDL